MSGFVCTVTGCEGFTTFTGSAGGDDGAGAAGVGVEVLLPMVEAGKQPPRQVHQAAVPLQHRRPT